jgi:IS30 family transposase
MSRCVKAWSNPKLSTRHLDCWSKGCGEFIRQYLPKGATMARVTQSECDLIAEHLNNRPRKRHGYKTPNQCFLQT